ncbi:MAG: hisD, partial [Conexibacter sp.]|nr:hisD [Conexibacter sp.]
MNVERLDFDGDADSTADAVRALAPAGVSVSGTVSEIVASIRTRGEQALLEYVERFDGVTGPLRVEQAELDEALERLDPEV